MMKKCFLRTCELDERQLLLRGNVFQHMVILMLSLLLINGFLKEEGITWAPGMWENMLILWAGIGLGLTEYILRGITPAGARQSTLYIFEGICGGVLLALSLTHILGEGRPLAADNALTEEGAHLIFALVMVGIFLTSAVKWLHDRHIAGSEE